MRRPVAGAMVAAAALLTAGLSKPQSYAWHLPPDVSPPPVPPDNSMSAAKVALGRRLFYDADLSIDGTLSCATCHEQHRAFTEGNATHPGVGGVPGRRNVMALANVAYFDPLTWADPRQHSLEQQVAVPFAGTHPVEMGMAGKEKELAQRLAADPCYRRMFWAAFPERRGRIDMTGVTRALAAFERTLLSFDSPYDRFRRGQAHAISPMAKRGAALFFGKAHCAACHSGINFTDGKFHKIGFYNSYPAGDRGLIEISGAAKDDGAFRTPSLRNVALTGPYMHDGSVKSLAAAIRDHLDRGKLRPSRDKALAHIRIGGQELTDLVTFLDSLSDRNFVTDPALALPKTACGKPL